MALRLTPCFAGAHMFAYSAFPATARPLVILKDEEPLGVTRATPLIVNAPTWNTGNPPWTVRQQQVAGFPRPWTQRLRPG